jgi:hypothetical protein
MKRFLTLALAGALVLGMGSVAYANICAFDPVPAATLLFPFVSYNYDNGVTGYGTTTRFSVTNVSSEAQIVHVTLWTDYSVPILDFNILLTGYDMQMINIRDILRDGQLPPTFQSTDAGGVSDDGPWSRRNTAVTLPAGIPDNPADPESTYGLVCDEAYPGDYATQLIDANLRGLLQLWLQSSQTADRGFELCNGTPVEHASWFQARDTTMDTWMYVTMDVVNECNKLFPSSEDYWGPSGVAMNTNVLVGDYQVINRDERFSEADNAVHIEADELLDSVIGPNDYPISFYGRYSNVTGLEDYREPLPTAWAVRYENRVDGGKAIKTYLRVFKTNTNTAFQIVPDLDPTLSGSQAVELYSRICIPYTYYTWDDEENVSTSSTNPWSFPGLGTVVPNLLPLETQEVDAAQFNLVGPQGWMMFVWPHSNLATYNSTPLYYQTWMGVKYFQEGDYSGSRDAQVLGNANCFFDQVLPGLGINYAYLGFAE